MKARSKSIKDRQAGFSGSSHCFVFVVCGDAEHIGELHYSLAALRRHSGADILVVTDSCRNEIPVVWDKVIDVTTPRHLTAHQAAIYLKTSLHRIVPPGRRYCYLDGDVIAMSQDVDGIFTASPSPVAFAADHIHLHEFSPYAMHCDCTERNRRDREELAGVLAEAYDRSYGAGGVLKTGWTDLDYEMHAGRVLFRIKAYLEHLRSPLSSSQLHDSAGKRWRAYWFESRSLALREPGHVADYVESTTAWRRDRRRESWISPGGHDVDHLQCEHLREAIKKTFGIAVTSTGWRHWNGGVFLFDERGHAFLEAWHEKTIRIFNDSDWRCRDQGTLAATVWEFGLQDARVLPQRFNCLLDPNAKATMLARSGEFLTTDAFLTGIRPVFAHVLGGFGNREWDVWKWVDACARGCDVNPPSDGTTPRE